MSSLSSERPRYLRRQWKQQKPYLPRSDSVPNLRLVEMGRKLLNCSSCGFALTNQSLPICVWCEVKLPDALVVADSAPGFPNSRAFKMRRASEPLFKKRLREERAGRARRIRVALSVSQFSNLDNFGPAPKMARISSGVVKSAIQEQATIDTEYQESEITSTNVAPNSAASHKLGSNGDSHYLLTEPMRSLRHKKRFTPTTSITSFHTKTSSVSIPITEYRSHSRSKSQLSLDSGGRLGQPSRPYYTAIRNNMSNSVRSSSPPFVWAEPSAHELGLNNRASITSSIMSSTTKLKTQARKSFTSPRSSIDQEIELRAALARDLGSLETEEDFSKSREQSRKSRMSRFTRGIVDLLRK